MVDGPEFKPGGFVPDGPQDVIMQKPTVFLRADVANALGQLETVQELIEHLAVQDSERLEDRAEAWGYTRDPDRVSPDAMTVTFDRPGEQ